MKYKLDKPVNVLSLGAGVQSSAMVFAYIDGLIKDMPDFAVFADTKSEPEAVYKWLEVLRSVAPFPILTPSRGNLVEDSLDESLARVASIPFFTKNEDGSQGMMRRQCTADYKLDVIRKAIRTELGYLPKQRVKHQVITSIGISTDEAQRMKDSRDKWITNYYPLIEMDWSRVDCFDYIKSKGFGDPPKSACWMCPYRSNVSWKNMKATDPDSFAKAVEFERAIQLRHSGSGRFNSVPFIHRSMIPLDTIDFDSLTPSPSLFGEDCEGMCGV